jgi:hypothetical protein
MWEKMCDSITIKRKKHMCMVSSTVTMQLEVHLQRADDQSLGWGLRQLWCG